MEVIVALVVGLVASVVVLVGDRGLRRWSLCKNLEPLVGVYEHQAADGTPEPGMWRSEIRYPRWFCRPGVLETEAWNHDKSWHWKGEVWMDERVPTFGNGYACHTDTSGQWGVHVFLAQPDGTINIKWREESTGQQGVQRWVRVEGGDRQKTKDA